MEDCGVELSAFERERVEIPLDEFDPRTARNQLGAGDSQHFGTAIESHGYLGLACEQFDHAARPRADIEQPSERTRSEQFCHRLFDLSIGGIERPDRVPFGGMIGEIALRGGIAFLVNLGKRCAIGGDHCLFFG